jgi:hypothetical protein
MFLCFYTALPRPTLPSLELGETLYNFKQRVHACVSMWQLTGTDEVR